MDEIIEIALRIEELRNLICEYCNIEDIVKLYIILQLNLPVKYTQKIYDEYIAIKYKQLKYESPISLDKKLVRCDVCNYSKPYHQIFECSICEEYSCKLCTKPCPNFVTCKGLICETCITIVRIDNICRKCNKLCCCVKFGYCKNHKHFRSDEFYT